MALPTIPYRGNGIDRIANWATYASSAVFRLSTGKKPDVIYASSPHLLAGLAGYFLAKRWRVPWVLEVRDLWPQVLVDMGQMSTKSPIYRVLESLEAFLYAGADRIVVLANGTRDYLVERDVPKDKILYIPNAADPQDFVVQESRADLRARYGFIRFTCVYTGAHGPANGLKLLLAAAQELKNEDLDIVLVGDGPSKVELQAATREANLTNVRFLDPIPKSEIPSILAAADVGLHVLADVKLFQYGVSPNKVFDYLAAGLPMVTNVPGEIGELVRTSGGGLAVKVNDLAPAIRELAHADTQRLSEMSDLGRRYVLQQHSRTQMVIRLQNLLDELAQA
jgi:glycosyltransferase involved in cell wall biosynthesis